MNQLRTILLLGALTGLLFFLGYLFGGEQGIFIAFLISLAMNFFSYFYSHKLVLSSQRAQPLDPQQFPQIYQMVKELADEYKIPMPKLWLIPTDVANAFATGRNPKNGHVAVTRGILDILEPNELRGVLAHELGHIKNRDILVSTIAITLASAIGMLANTMRWSSFAGDQQRGGGGKAFLIAMLMPVVAALIHMGISRSRELMADESGAHASQDPLALASALQKLEESVKRVKQTPSSPAQAATASLYIVYPFRGKTIASLFSTHPSTEERVARLKEMAQKMPSHLDSFE